jgi:hypothetical protein
MGGVRSGGDDQMEQSEETHMKVVVEYEVDSERAIAAVIKSSDGFAAFNGTPAGRVKDTVSNRTVVSVKVLHDELPSLVWEPLTSLCPSETGGIQSWQDWINGSARYIVRWKQAKGFEAGWFMGGNISLGLYPKIQAAQQACEAHRRVMLQSIAMQRDCFKR